MNRFAQFLRTTMVGGLLFLVPLVAIAIVVEKALAITRRFLDPLADHIPVHSVLGLQRPVFLAIAVVILFCFLAGLFARAAIAQTLVEHLEKGVLSRIPGYELMKRVGESMLGVEKQGAYPVVLVCLGDTWQLALQTGQVEDGMVAVFIPCAPNPQSGAVYFIPTARLKPSGISPAAAMKILQHYGAGSGAVQRSLSVGTTPRSGPDSPAAAAQG